MASIASLLDETRPLGIFELPVREDPTVANRRTLPRVNGRFELRLEDGTTYRGVDLSFGGLMCVGAEPIWPGNIVSFELFLSTENRPLAVRGRVAELVPARRGAIAMRVRFEGIDPSARKRIALFMARSQGL